MLFAFDLWSAADVRQHASQILEKLRGASRIVRQLNDSWH
jgi:hypothetical protein